MNRIDLNQAYAKIKSTKGRFFSAVFTKKDGTDRYIRCRTGVKKHVKGVGLNYSPLAHGLVSVWDIENEAYRMIRLKTLKSIQVDGIVYSIVR